MTTILFHYPNLDNNRIFKQHPFGFNDPLIYLKEKLYSVGYDLKTSDSHPLSECEWVIFFDAPESKFIRYHDVRNKLRKLKKILKKNESRDLYKECTENNFKNIALILWEGKAICPENFTKALHDKFSYIFTWNDDYVDNKKFFKFYHPLDRNIPKAPKTSFKEKKLLVNISMNKYSNYRYELYCARRKSIEYFEINFPNDFDLYGVGWNKPVGRLQNLFTWTVKIHPSYRGKINKKADILPRYKFALAYENMQGEKGYISEKIFDCFRCNTVPIYWGAPNVEDFIDPKTFIDRRKFKSNKELADFIVNMKENEYNKYLKAIEFYLKSEKYKLFSAENFADTIINTLKL